MIDTIKRRNRTITHLLIVAAAIIGLVTGCSQFCGQGPQPYLLLYAFEQEGTLLSEKMTIERTDHNLGRTVLTGKLAGKDIVLAESGIGMTNAAMTTQRMIDQYDPIAVIFTGIAGAIDSAVAIGDIVVPSKWIEHDYGYYGSNGFEYRSIGIYVPADSAVRKVAAFSSDEHLLKVLNDALKTDVALKSIGDRAPEIIVGGVGVSGNSFIDRKETREWLASEFAADVVDMESAAVGQVCTVNDVPFIVFRSASDLAGGSGSETAREQLDQFFEVAAFNSSALVIALLGAL